MKKMKTLLAVSLFTCVSALSTQSQALEFPNCFQEGDSFELLVPAASGNDAKASGTVGNFSLDTGILKNGDVLSFGALVDSNNILPDLTASEFYVDLSEPGKMVIDITSNTPDFFIDISLPVDGITKSILTQIDNVDEVLNADGKLVIDAPESTISLVRNQMKTPLDKNKWYSMTLLCEPVPPPQAVIINVVVEEGLCGNGITETAEECDDGNLINTDACSNDCKDNNLPGAVCGNGIVEENEQCDDANKNDNDDCRNTCTVPVVIPDKGGCSLNTAANASNWLSGLFLLSSLGLVELKRRISK